MTMIWTILKARVCFVWFALSFHSQRRDARPDTCEPSLVSVGGRGNHLARQDIDQSCYHHVNT